MFSHILVAGEAVCGKAHAAADVADSFLTHSLKAPWLHSKLVLRRACGIAGDRGKLTQLPGFAGEAVCGKDFFMLCVETTPASTPH